MKNIILQIMLIVFCALVLLVSIRGYAGTPSAKELNTSKWRENGPFELSPERGRYALVYTLVEDKSVFFSDDIGKFSDPDVAYNVPAKRFVSLFAPGLSFILIPGYALGKVFGFAQVGTVAVVALFALANMLLIRAIAKRLGANSVAATIGGLAFLFASPAYAYAVTLYQHHISTFLILLGLYTLIRWNNIWSLAIIWFLFAAGIPIDNPNLIFFLPIAVYALGRFLSISKTGSVFKVDLKVWGLVTMFTMLIPVMFFLWYNNAANGSPLQLSGTLKTYSDIKKETNLLDHELTEAEKAEKRKVKDIGDKTVTGFFRTRNLMNGFYIHLLSPDRGILWFTPVMFLGVIGAYLASKRTKHFAVTLTVAVTGVLILLYSMWGDPYGGWAFGSRYMIPAYALLSIFIGLLLTYWKRKYLFLIGFALILTYSVAVNTLGAITSSANPPQIEAVALEGISGMKQKYTFERNVDYLINGTVKSFTYQSFVKQYVNPVQFYSMLIGTVLVVLYGFLGKLALSNRKEHV